MGGYTLPVATSQDPNDPNSPNPYALYGYNSVGGMSPYAPAGVDNSATNWGTAISQGGQDVGLGVNMNDILTANRNQISTEGNQIGQEAANQLNYYSPLQQQDTGAENTALNQLDQQPGYTPDQASQINVDYSQFNTSPDQY